MYVLIIAAAQANHPSDMTSTKENLVPGFRWSFQTSGMERAAKSAFHEFGPGNKLRKDVEPIEPVSDWSKKVMSEAKAIDAAIFQEYQPPDKKTGN